jgi:pimeloyl-ACP methyl ester carboxylesterase
MKTLVRMSPRPIDVVVLLALISCQLGQSGSASEFPAAQKQPVTPQEQGKILTEAIEVPLETPTGTLFGTLVLPAGNPPFPVVLIIAGSGPTDRDGNSVGYPVKPNCLKMIAEGLAQSGIASLRYDKRGVAKSAPARAAVNSFDIQVDDAASWIAWLGKSSRFNAVGIVGHSEGASIGTIAAQRGGVRALVLLAGAGRRFDEVFIEQMGRAVKSGQLSQSALTSMSATMAELRAGRAVTSRPPNIPDELWTGLFQPRAQEYLISLFRFDPVAELAKLKPADVRILVVQGTTDLTGGADDPARLAAAVGSKPVMIEGMSHELKTAPLDRRANDKASEDPRVPLAPELLKQMIPFLTNALQ